MQSLVTWISDTAAAAPTWWVVLTSVVSSASAIAAATRTPKDDKIIGRIYRIVDLLALNFGHAKDHPPGDGSMS